jgi:molecular chaperone DnaK
MAAERAKRTLSKLGQTTVTCTHAGKVLTVPLSRADFENLTRDLLVRTRLTTQQVLRQASLTWEQVDQILLVGGSTHMPMTQQMLRELTNKAPNNTLAVSEVVARGAAIHAGIVAMHHGGDEGAMLSAEAQEVLADVVEINVNSHSLGIEIKQGQERLNNILIPKNTQLPTAASRVYNTVGENQRRVHIKVLQGEAEVGELHQHRRVLDRRPAGAAENSPIQVRCGVASNGLIDVMALDMTTAAWPGQRSTAPANCRRGDRARPVAARVEDSVMTSDLPLAA